MATLPTLRPTSYVSGVQVSTTAVGNVNDGSDATWNESAVGTGINGEWVYEITDMPADFASMDSNQITVKIRCGVSFTGDDGWSVRALLRNTSGTLVSNTPTYSSLNVATTAVQEFTFTLTHTGTNDKTTWDAVRLVIDFNNTKVKGNDGNSLRFHDTWADGTYTTAGLNVQPSTLSITPTFPAATLTGGASTTTLERQISASQDDVRIVNTTSHSFTVNQTIGVSTTFGTNFYYNGLRFLNITIPNGATIQSAYMEFVSSGASGTITNVRSVIAADNANDSAQIVDETDYHNRVRTTAKVQWDPTSWPANGNTGQTPDITSVIQEIVNRGGWVSGNALQLLIDDDGTITSSGSASGVWDSWDTSTTNASKLVIEYVDPSAGDTLEPTVLSITPSFPTATVVPGEVTTTPALLTITPTFGTAEIKRISYFQPALLSVAPTFPTATLSSEATITPALLSVAVSLPTASVDSLATITPALLSVSPTFGTAEIKESVNLAPSLLTVTTNFSTATIFSDLFLEPTLLTISTTFPAGQLNQAFTSNLLTPTVTIFTPGIKEVQAVQPSLLTVAFTLHTAQLNQNINASTHQVTPAFGTATLGLYVQSATLGVAPTLGNPEISSTADLAPATVTPTVAFGAATVEGAGTTQDVQPALLSVAISFPTGNLAATATLASSVVSVPPSFGTATLGITTQPAMLTVTPAFGNAQLDFGIEDDAVLTVGTTFPTATVIGDQGLSPDVVNVIVVFPVGNLANAGTPLTPLDTEGQGIAQEMCAARGLPGDLDYLGCLNALNGGSDLDKLGALTALGATPGADLLLALEQLANDGLGKADFNELMRRWAESGNF